MKLSSKLSAYLLACLVCCSSAHAAMFSYPQGLKRDLDRVVVAKSSVAPAVLSFSERYELILENVTTASASWGVL
jgi:hypothetical protein